MLKNILIGVGMILVFLGIGSVDFSSFFNTSATVVLSQGTPIRIGFIGPLSGDGAAWGEIEKNTVQMVADQINEEGGILGRPIKILSEDGQCDGATAVSAAQKLIFVDKVGILLVSCSQEVLPIAPIANENKVLEFASYSSASAISEAGDYVFRNSWLNKDMSNGMARETYARANTAAIISEESEFAVDLRNLFVEAYQNEGGNILAQENFSQGSKDVRTHIAKLIATRPQAIVVNPNSPGTGLAILKELRVQNYKGVIIGNFFGSSTEVQAAPEAKGMIYIADPSVKDSAEKTAFLEAYKSQFGVYPALLWPAVARYDAMHILAQAIESVGDNPTAIKDYLYTVKSFSGLLGTYGFDQNGDVVGIQPTVSEIK